MFLFCRDTRIDITELTSGCTALFMACQVSDSFNFVSRVVCFVTNNLIIWGTVQDGHPLDVAIAVVDKWISSPLPTSKELSSSAGLHLELHGWSPLFVAVGSGHTAIVERLCSVGFSDKRQHLRTFVHVVLACCFVQFLTRRVDVVCKLLY